MNICQNSWCILPARRIAHLNELGREIRRLRERAGLSQKELGQRVGVDGSYISMIETGRQPDPGRELLRALSRELGTSIEALLRLAGYIPAAPRERSPQEIITDLQKHWLSQVVNVPVLQQAVSAGGGALVVPETIPFSPRPEDLRHEFVAVRVSGHCMEPLIQEGHYVIVDKTASPTRGDFVVATSDDEAFVKILVKVDGTPIVRDYAGNVKPLAPDATILGVVKGIFFYPPKVYL